MEQWKSHAACLGSREFLRNAYPPEGLMGGAVLTGYRRCKDVCAGCSVSAECLSYAVLHDERNGVWGGVVFATTHIRSLWDRVAEAMGDMGLMNW
jgi:hypothetical protein